LSFQVTYVSAVLIKSLIKKFLFEEFFLNGQLKPICLSKVVESFEPELCSSPAYSKTLQGNQESLVIKRPDPDRQ